MRKLQSMINHILLICPSESYVFTLLPRFVRNEALKRREEMSAMGALSKNHDFEELNCILGDFASLLPAVRVYETLSRNH